MLELRSHRVEGDKPALTSVPAPEMSPERVQWMLAEPALKKALPFSVTGPDQTFWLVMFAVPAPRKY